MVRIYSYKKKYDSFNTNHNARCNGESIPWYVHKRKMNKSLLFEMKKKHDFP